MCKTPTVSKFQVGQVAWGTEYGRLTAATVIECDGDYIRLSSGESSYHGNSDYFATADEAWKVLEAEAAEDVRYFEECLKKQVNKLDKVRKDRAEFSETAARIQILQDAVDRAADEEDSLSCEASEANLRRIAAEEALAEFKASI